MQPQEVPTYHPTVWPPDLPELPPLRRLRHVLVEEGFYEWAGPTEDVELPPDFVLRELLETSGPSDEQLLDFVNTWGPLVDTGRRAFDVLGAHRYEAARQRLAEAQDRHGRVDAGGLVSMEAMRAAARNLRILSGHLLAYLEGGAADRILEPWAAEDLPMDDVSDAWFHWTKHLNQGLTPFAVHVRTDTGPAAGRPIPTLYNACCLQLVQYVALQAPPKRCANERCGRPFTKQRGLAKFGQYRTLGVRYCSPQCAKAQQERERRRRRAEQDKPDAGGVCTQSGSDHTPGDEAVQSGQPSNTPGGTP
jgi:hypothetical protein